MQWERRRRGKLEVVGRAVIRGSLGGCADATAPGGEELSAKHRAPCRRIVSACRESASQASMRDNAASVSSSLFISNSHCYEPVVLFAG